MSEIYDAASEIREPLGELRDHADRIAGILERLLEAQVNASTRPAADVEAEPPDPMARSMALAMTIQKQTEHSETLVLLIGRLEALERSVWDLYPDSAERAGVSKPPPKEASARAAKAHKRS
jgi:hypothetical protein